MALLMLLDAANAQPRNALGVGLSAVHVHHGLRGDEADADLAFVETLCAAIFEIPLSSTPASPTASPASARLASPRQSRRPRAPCATRSSKSSSERVARTRPHRAHPGRPGRDRSDEAAARSLDRGVERNNTN